MLGYVIAIISILSNVKIVCSNENNQYATTTATAAVATPAATANKTPFATTAIEGTDDPVAVFSTQKFHTSNAVNAYPMSKLVTMQSVEIPSISALHDEVEFMQHTLHNISSMIDDEESSKRYDQKEVKKKQVERPKSNGMLQRQQGQYLLQQDAVNAAATATAIVKNPKQLLSTMHLLSMNVQQINSNEKIHNHAQVIQQQNHVYSTTPPLTYDDRFMNEHKNTKNTIESNASTMLSPAEIATTTSNIPKRNVQSERNNQAMERINTDQSDNHDDSRKSGEITSMPMKIVRDNVNATFNTVSRYNEPTDNESETIVNETFVFGNRRLSTDEMQNGPHRNDNDDINSDDSLSLEDSQNLRLNERSRYLETGLGDFNDNLPILPQSDVDINFDVNDQIEWPSDAGFEDLTLDDINDDNKKSPEIIQSRSWTLESSKSMHEIITLAPVSTHNILKISKSNKPKSIKRLAAPLQSPQALLEIRLNKSPLMSSTNRKQFINSQSFQHITNLYNQYEWNADELRTVLSSMCSSNMYVYLNALVSGKIWAAKGNNVKSVEHFENRTFTLPFECHLFE